MGGLRKYMPITAVTFIIGWLAIAGVPPFAGFWSKDEILLYAYNEQPGALGRRPRHRAAHRLLHEPPGVPGVLRRGALQRTPSEGRASTAAEPARVAVADDRAARGPRRPRHRRRRAQPARSPTTCTSSRTGSHPVLGEQRGASSTSPPAPRSASPSSPSLAGARRHRRSPRRVYLQKRIGAGRARDPRRGLVLRRAPSPPSWAAPAEQGFEAVATFDAQVVDGAVNGVGRGRARRRPGPPRPPDRLRPQLRPRRGRRRRRPPRLLPHPGGRVSALLLASEASHAVATSPLTAAVLVPFLGARRGRAHPDGPRRAAPARRPAVRHRHRRHHRSGCSPTSSTHDAGFQYEVNRVVDLRLRDLVAPRHRRRLAVPRRADRAAVPAGDRRRRPAPRAEAVLRVAARAAGRAASACSARSTCSCSSSCSRSCSCRCTSSSAAGATASGSTRRSSSSSSRCSARR